MEYMNVFSFLSSNIEIFIDKGGYIILFLFTILEGIPLIGMVVPGHIAIIAGGFLAKLGTLNLGLVITVSIVSALLGDYIGFYLGRRYGMSFIDRLRPYFFITDSSIAKAQDLLSRHTGKALIIGRFTPATRALMPFLVGTNQTSVGCFWFFNIIGGISWVVSSVLVGYIFGSAYHVFSDYIGKILIGAIIFAVIFVWGYRFANDRFHIFKKYELFVLILNLVSLGTFALVVDKLIDNNFRLSFDILVNNFMDKINHLYPWIVSLSKLISEIGGTMVVGVLGITFVIYMLINRKWRSASIMFLSVGLTAFFTGTIKLFFDCSRPVNALIDSLGDPSFPSGHSSMIAAFMVIIAYLSAYKIKPWIKRESVISLCISIVIVVGLSRLVLNVHWFSDVVAGWSLGIFFATASILFVRYAGSLFLKK